MKAFRRSGGGGLADRGAWRWTRWLAVAPPPPPPPPGPGPYERRGVGKERRGIDRYLGPGVACRAGVAAWLERIPAKCSSRRTLSLSAPVKVGSFAQPSIKRESALNFFFVSCRSRIMRLRILFADPGGR